MNQNGNVLPIQTLRKLREDEISCPASIKEREDFDAAIQNRHGTSISLPEAPPPIDIEPAYSSTSEAESSMPDVDEISDYDKYMNADLLLP